MTVQKPIGAKREGNTTLLIYDRLRSEILTGKLAPGSTLSQLSIAKANGTSRGPVREAMQRLQQDQLVVGHANQRFVVAPFDLLDLENVLSLHLANVALAIRVSVPRLTDREVAALDRHVDAMEASLERDTDQWEAAYRGYAIAISRHAGEKSVALIRELIDNIQRYRVHLLSRFPRVFAGAAAFRGITDAARARDGRAAAALYTEFFGTVSSLILAGASPRHDPARLRGYIDALLSEPGT